MGSVPGKQDRKYRNFTDTRIFLKVSVVPGPRAPRGREASLQTASASATREQRSAGARPEWGGGGCHLPSDPHFIEC